MIDLYAAMQMCLVATSCIPGAMFLVLGLGWLLGWSPKERVMAALTNATLTASFLAALVLMWWMISTSSNVVSIAFGNWFSVGNYHFPLAFFVDWLSLPMVTLTILLSGLVSAFSKRYLHRERGFLRFFFLLQLFTFGAVLVFTSGSFDLLIAGWELVGITSVLLISFFQERVEPVRNAIRVFATYRGCDLGLLVGVFVLYHHSGAATFERLFIGTWPDQTTTLAGATATTAALLLLLASMGKSAQAPFSGWLPRAMEGPTPSSAIFYGAISVHVGAYLLLRASPVLEASPVASAAVVIIGAWSALHGTFAGRVCPDAKTALAYAAMAQLGLIFVEIGLGFSWLALAHIVGHSLVRMLQFLRAPSMLHEYHGMHAASGGHLGRTGLHYEAMIPASLRSWLYRLALDRGHHDTAIDRYVIDPLSGLARILGVLNLRSTSEVTPARPASIPVTPLQIERRADG